jgi:hypothetical protein
MRLFFSIFLLVSMLSSMALSVVQQISSIPVYEFKECNNDDNADSEETEAKSETEKEIINHNITTSIEMGFDAAFFSKKRIHEYNQEIESSLYSALPYNPPEA